MQEAVNAMLALAGAAFVTMVCGGALAFGVASVCRWLKWAPFNLTINVNNYRDADDS